VNLQNRNI